MLLVVLVLCAMAARAEHSYGGSVGARSDSDVESRSELAQAARVVWRAGAAYEFRVTSKWWLGSGKGSHLHGGMVADFQPPTSAEDHGLACRLTLRPLYREAWPPSGAQRGQRGAEQAAESDTAPDKYTDNAWVILAQPGVCSPIVSRFGGPYVPLPKPQQSTLDEQPAFQRLSTAFYFTRLDNGRLGRVYFFANETLSSRNFKRGLISFLSFVQPTAHEGGSGSYRAVDQDEHGVYVPWWWWWW